MGKPVKRISVKTAASALLVAGGAAAAAARVPALRETRSLVMAEGDRDEIDGSLSICLERFSIPLYPSGRPRQYVSEVKTLDNETKSLEAAEISVNHPLRRNGWWIYQYSCGPDENDVPCTELKCVKDPLLPLAVFGGALIALGALCLCFTGRRYPAPSHGRRGRIAAWVCAAAVVALPAFVIGRAVMRPEPVPALQSWFMAPHVAAYSASYLLLLFAAFGIGRRTVPLGFLLMTLGLLLGAAWGKFAWSDWWQFDPKENWSLASWLAIAAHLHFAPDSRAAKWTLRIGAVLIIITLTWVNFSRFAAGLHSYA